MKPCKINTCLLSLIEQTIDYQMDMLIEGECAEAEKDYLMRTVSRIDGMIEMANELKMIVSDPVELDPWTDEDELWLSEDKLTKPC